MRSLGPEALALADRFFFETLVRVHREGEGAPYTGLKPAGTPVDPGIDASDTALETGSVDPLVKMLTAEVDKGLRHRFAEAAEARKHADESVGKGREYVAAYVEFVHYAERLLLSAIERGRSRRARGARALTPGPCTRSARGGGGTPDACHVGTEGDPREDELAFHVLPPETPSERRNVTSRVTAQQ